MILLTEKESVRYAELADGYGSVSAEREAYLKGVFASLLL